MSRNINVDAILSDMRQEQEGVQEELNTVEDLSGVSLEELIEELEEESGLVFNI